MLTQEIKWLQGRLALLESVLWIICSSPAATATMEVQVSFKKLVTKPGQPVQTRSGNREGCSWVQSELHQLLNPAQHLRVWVPLLPARLRHSKSLWAPAIDHLLSSLLSGQVWQDNTPCLPVIVCMPASAL